MGAKGRIGHKDRPAEGAGICFEPLEPRLLLSGTLGAGGDLPTADALAGPPLSHDVGALQANVLQRGQNATGIETRVDLLSRASALKISDAAQSPTPDSNQPAANGRQDSPEPSADILNQAARRELVIINSNLSDTDRLIADLQDGDTYREVELVILDASCDGVDQVSEILSEHSELAAVHFLTHGSDGQIQLGDTWLNSATLTANSDAVAGWGRALSESGDFLFYGCNVASGSAGQLLLNTIASLTGADVAASENATGHTSKGGDWTLEYRAGVVETHTAVQPGAQNRWSRLLVPPVINSNGGGPTAAINVAENTTAVTTVTATDADSGDVPTYSITGGADAALFGIDTNSGDLTFNTAPDFENPADSNTDNLYEVEVTADDGNGGTDVQTLSVTVTNADNGIWISPDQDSAGGADGLPGGWREGEVLQLGGPDLALGPATDGDFASVIDFDIFTADACDPGALHYVTRDLTIGSGANQFNLQIGDVLVSFNQNETILAAHSATGLDLAAGMNDLLVFRPDTMGDFTSGTFSMLLNGVPYPGGGAISNLNAISLVEQDTYVGNTLLAAGSFLFSEQTGSGLNTPNHIYHFTATDVGAVAAAGTSQILIDGNDIGIEAVTSSHIRGLDLIEKPTTIGGLAFDSGDILVTLNVDDGAVGDTPTLATSTSDVFVLKVARSEPEAGNLSAATAEMVLDGSDVNFDGTERVYAIAVIPDNYGPAVGGDISGAVTEDTGVIGGHISDSGTLTVADPNPGESSFAAETLAGIYGNLDIDVAGNWTYTADNSQAAIQGLNTGDSLTDLFLVSTADGTTQRVTITVAGADEPVNVPPVAAADSFTFNEGSTATLDLAANDSDADDGLDPTSIAIVSGPTYGSIVVNGDGTVDYTHDGTENFADSFTYTIDDLSGATSNIVSVSLTVTPQNDAPVARPDGVHLSFGGNDFVEVPDHISLQMTNNLTMEAWINHSGGGTGSQLILNKEGEYEMGITADTGEIKYAIADSTNLWTWHDTGHFVTVGEWIHVAVTFDGGFGEIRTYINGQLVDTFAQAGPVGDVYDTYNNLYIGGRGNATDQRFQGLIDEVRVWNSTRTQGDIQSNMNGLLTGGEVGLAGYWRLDEAGTGSIVDLAGNGNDGVLGGAEGAAAAPTYQGYVTDEDSPLAMAAVSGVLANDSDQEGGPLSVAAINGSAADVGSTIALASGALVRLNADGGFSYDPRGQFDDLVQGETATDTFTYVASDGSNDSNTATVTITVSGVNDTPVAVADSFTVAEGSTTTLTLAANDSDIDDGLDPASIVIGTGPNNGSLVVNANGTVDYTHDGTENFADSFTYTIEDNAGVTSNTVTVSLAVTPVNDNDPVADNESFTVVEGGTATEADLVAGASLLDGDTDIDLPHDTLTVNTVPVAGPSHGSLTLNDNGTFTYTHDGTESFADSFTYELLDADGGVSDTGTVSITITPVNDNDPVAVDESITVVEGGTATTLDGGATSVLANDTDSDLPNDTLSAALGVGPAHGSLTLNPDGTFSYTHDGSENFSDAFTYFVSDADGGIADTGAVTIAINPANDAPIAAADSFTVDEGSTTTLNLAGNDSDVDDGLDLTSITIVSGPTNGSIIVNGNGTVDYSHDGTENFADSFTYTIDDNSGVTSNTATASLTITPQNDVPLAAADSITVDEGSTTILDLAGNDSDADDGLDLTSVAIVSGPTNGSLVVNADGTVNYTHDGSETIADAFTYTIDDLAGATSNVVTVSITVAPVNDTPAFGGVNAGTVTEDGDPDSDGLLESSGVLTIADPDPGESTFQAGTVAGTYGSLSIDTLGNWTYAVVNSQTAIQQLDAGESISDMLTVTAADGTPHNVTITIHGAEDVPSIGGTFMGTVAKDGVLTAAGALTITDADAGDNPLSFVALAATPGDNGYGSFALTGATWTYTLNNAHAAVQAMNAGDTLTDTHTFTATDGSTREVTITINADVSADASGNVPLPPGGGGAPDRGLAPDEGDDTPEPRPEPEPQPDLAPPPEDEGSPSEEIQTPYIPPPRIAGIGSPHGRLPRYYVPTLKLPVPDESNASQNAFSSIDLRGLEHLRKVLAVQAGAWLEPVAVFFSPDVINTELDRIQVQIDAYLKLETEQGRLFIGTATGIGASLFVGYVVWALRGSSLVFGALSAMPMWRCFDPLPVLLGKDRRKEQDKQDKRGQLHSEETEEQRIGDLLGSGSMAGESPESSGRVT